MLGRSVVVLAVLMVALPAGAQDELDEAARATAGACVEFSREQIPACVMALQRQMLQLQAVVRDRSERIRALEAAVRVLSDKQNELVGIAHCHESQPNCQIPGDAAPSTQPRPLLPNR